MITSAHLDHLLRGARRRVALLALLQCVPWLLVGGALAWRGLPPPWHVAALAVALALAAAWAWRAAGAIDAPWLVRALDAARGDMEDSSALLYATQPPANPLQVLQRARLQQRLAERPTPDLRPPWPGKGRLLGRAAVAAACLALVALWPAADTTVGPAGGGGPVPAGPAHPARLASQRIEVRPPAYTGLGRRTVDSLSARAPEGSTLHWTLRFDPSPRQATLVFLDGRTLPLQRQGEAWTAQLRLQRPALYRLVVDQPLPKLHAGPHRLEAVRDRAPTVRVLQPARSLTLLTAGQGQWPLVFEASDDHGLAPSAQLRITRTEGGGENIVARRSSVALRGNGSARRQRYAYRVDLAALGLVEGDDVIVQLVASDRRAPAPQATASASVILRWPMPAATEATGLDGLAKKTMPAYFRSQRQIIIDAEALLKEQRRLPADQYLERSDTIGVDQRLLRLRYGQFLGEEAEGAPTLPTNDAEAEVDVEAAAGTGEDGERAAGGADDANGAATAHSPDDGHDHAGEPGRKATFGEQQAVLEEFGHTHDVAEAATLLDPATRTLLRAALDAMWQSELALRQGQPELALPHANRALRFIKQVQQAERIYLPRVGNELPPVDLARRLGGDRAGLGDRSDPLAPADAGDPTLARAWQALAPVPGAAAPLDLAPLARWLDANQAAVDDPLAVAVAIERVREEPGCLPCRSRLRAQLWPLLQRPTPAPGERAAPAAVGDAYLDALRREPPP